MSDNAEIIEVQDGTRYSAVSNDDHMRFLDETIISLRQQLAAVTAERDAAVSALALATNTTPGKGTGVWVPLDKWTELHAQLAAYQVERGVLVRLRDDTDNILWSLKPEDVPGAINWGDLGARETQEVIDEERRWYRVVIEEADPANPALHASVLAGLVAKGWKADDIEIETAW